MKTIIKWLILISFFPITLTVVYWKKSKKETVTKLAVVAFAWGLLLLFAEIGGHSKPDTDSIITADKASVVSEAETSSVPSREIVTDDTGEAEITVPSESLQENESSSAETASSSVTVQTAHSESKPSETTMSSTTSKQEATTSKSAAASAVTTITSVATTTKTAAVTTTLKTTTTAAAKTTTTSKATTTTTTTTTTKAATTTTQNTAPKANYVLNTNTMKFHFPSCNSAKRISSENRWDYNGTRAEVIAMGYVPCQNCKP